MHQEAPAGRRHRRTAIGAAVSAVAASVVVLVGVTAAPASAQTGSSISAACPSGSVRTAGFGDVPRGNPHAVAIDCLVWWRVTQGVRPSAYQPAASISRDQAASMLVRLLRHTGDHPGTNPSAGFTDIAGNVHAANINVLASLGVVAGADGRFLPDLSVTRGQLATMIVQLLEDVYGESLPVGPTFIDMGSTVHETNIRKLVGAGITTGVTADRFAPFEPVSRAQMASFVMRAANRLVLAGKAAPPQVAATPGCGTAPSSSGSGTVSVGGSQRSYVLQLPTGYDRNRPYPIVFGFHGATTSGAAFQRYGNLGSATRSEAIVVYPDAAGAGRAWDFGGSADVAFFDALLAQLRSRLCIDDDRVFAAGHSSGGFFSNHLGCVRGDVLRGIAPVSGGGPFTWRSSCSGRVAAWIAHGANDGIVPLSSGEGSRNHWRGANGCSTSTRPAGSGVAYEGCAAGHPVHWVRYDGGHEFPRFAAGEIWSFFRGL